jgi:hypothetical protein
VLLKRYSCMPFKIPSAKAMQSNWWKGIAHPSGLTSFLDLVLRRSTSWHPEIQIWGIMDGNRVDIVTDGNGDLNDIYVRLDVRKIDCALIASICKFCQDNGIVFLLESGDVIYPKQVDLMNYIFRSSAFRFMEDPEEFLLALKRLN